MSDKFFYLAMQFLKRKHIQLVAISYLIFTFDEFMYLTVGEHYTISFTPRSWQNND